MIAQLYTNNENVNLGLKVLFLRADLMLLTFDIVVFFLKLPARRGAMIKVSDVL